MTIFFAGSVPTDFDEHSASVPVTTNASERAPYCRGGCFFEDADFVRKSIGIGNGPTDDFWYSYWTFGSSFGAHAAYCEFYDDDFSDSQPVLRLATDILGGSPALQIWNGSSWDTVASGASMGGTLCKLDIQFVRDDSAGIFRLYKDNVLVCEATGIDTNRAAWTDINAIRHAEGSSAGGDDYAVSGMIFADVDTRLMKIVEGTGKANGTHTDFSGGAADVDDMTVDDADSISSQADGDQITFTDSLDAVIDTDHDIIASVISVRGRAVGNVNPYLKPLYRSGGTTYAGASKLMPGANQNVQFVTPNDPDTAAPWTPAGIEAAEHGLQASAS